MRGRGGGYRNTRPQQQRREGVDVGMTNWETENTKPDQDTATGGGIGVHLTFLISHICGRFHILVENMTNITLYMYVWVLA